MGGELGTPQTRQGETPAPPRLGTLRTGGLFIAKLWIGNGPTAEGHGQHLQSLCKETTFICLNVSRLGKSFQVTEAGVPSDLCLRSSSWSSMETGSSMGSRWVKTVLSGRRWM